MSKPSKTLDDLLTVTGLLREILRDVPFEMLKQDSNGRRFILRALRQIAGDSTETLNEYASALSDDDLKPLLKRFGKMDSWPITWTGYTADLKTQEHIVQGKLGVGSQHYFDLSTSSRPNLSPSFYAVKNVVRFIDRLREKPDERFATTDPIYMQAAKLPPLRCPESSGEVILLVC
jgi:hypothetical protein